VVAGVTAPDRGQPAAQGQVAACSGLPGGTGGAGGWDGRSEDERAAGCRCSSRLVPVG
jgi:hypothetical protein